MGCDSTQSERCVLLFFCGCMWWVLCDSHGPARWTRLFNRPFRQKQRASHRLMSTSLSLLTIMLGLEGRARLRVRCSLRYKSKDRIPVDNVTKKTLLDLQKRFPIHPANSQFLAADCCGLRNPPGSRYSGSTAGWLGTWDGPLRTEVPSVKIF